MLHAFTKSLFILPQKPRDWFFKEKDVIKIVDLGRVKMVNLTPEIKKKLLELGRYTFDDPGSDINPKEVSEKLIKSSYEVLTEIIGERNCPGHITYTNKFPELISWAIGLICIRYNLYLLQEKKIDRHCKTHKLPCQEGGIFHDELFNEVKKSFYELVIDDYEKEIKKGRRLNPK